MNKMNGRKPFYQFCYREIRLVSLTRWYEIKSCAFPMRIACRTKGLLILSDGIFKQLHKTNVYSHFIGLVLKRVSSKIGHSRKINTCNQKMVQAFELYRLYRCLLQTNLFSVEGFSFDMHAKGGTFNNSY